MYCRTIRLLNGGETIVDEADYHKMSVYKWYRVSTGYAARFTYQDGKTITHYMHREIMDCPKDCMIDHINRKPLDNRRCNLRFANPQTNAMNATRKKNNSTGFKGVFTSGKDRFRAKIGINGKSVHIGCFGTPEEAAEAYRQTAIKLYGEFVCDEYNGR